MDHPKDTDPESEYDVDLGLSLAPPSSSPLHHKPQRPRPISEPLSSPSLERRRNKRRSTNDASTSDNQELPPAVQEARRQRTKADETLIEPPYPWATDRRSKIHTMKHLQSNGITKITGDVKCNQCKETYEMEYDLASKIGELMKFVAKIQDECHDRAPSSWVTPILPNCEKCNKEKCVEAVTPVEHDSVNINWLFLLLGQLIGCLNLEQLKHFCTQTSRHRTGAKDRLIYLTYITLINQLEPKTLSTNS